MYYRPDCLTGINSERRPWGGAERTSSGRGGGPERGLQVPRAGPVGCIRL